MSDVSKSKYIDSEDKNDGSHVGQERQRIGSRINGIVDEAGKYGEDVLKIGGTVVHRLVNMAAMTAGIARRTIGDGWDKYRGEAGKSTRDQ